MLPSWTSLYLAAISPELNGEPRCAVAEQGEEVKEESRSGSLRILAYQPNLFGKESAKGEEELSRINVMRALKEPAGKKGQVDRCIKELRKGRSMSALRSA